MATTIEDLLHDVEMLSEVEKTASGNRQVAEARLIAALAADNISLKSGERVVIGNTLVSRPYQSLALQLSPFRSVSAGNAIPEGV